MKFSKKSFSSFLIFLCFSIVGFCQKYKIANTTYFINGTTKENHIEKKIKIDYKSMFNDEIELKNYLEELKTDFENLRLFSDVQIEYLINPANLEVSNNFETENSDAQKNEILDENSLNFVSLQIKIVDASNFIVVPYYKYDSKDGNVIKAKLQNANFLGTTNPLESDFFIGLNPKKDNSGVDVKFGFELENNFPFYFGIVESSWNNKHSFSYTIGKEIPEWDFDTGLSFKIPLDRVSFDLDFSQKFANNFDYNIFSDAMYFSEKVNFAIPIKLFKTKTVSNIIYTPSINFVYNWKPNEKINLMNDDLISPEILFSNKISLGKIDWVNNFRKGISFYAQYDVGYNFLINKTVTGVNGEFLSFTTNDFVGFNTRLYGFYYLNKNQSIGSRIRGIRNDEYFNTDSILNKINQTSTSSAVVLNLDFPIHLFSTDFEKWKMSKLKKLNFEAIISPFIDVALSYNRVTGKYFALEDGFYTFGVEGICYPANWKSLQIRACIGLDLGQLLFNKWINTKWRAKTSPYEITFGFGLHY